MSHGLESAQAQHRLSHRNSHRHSTRHRHRYTDTNTGPTQRHNKATRSRGVFKGEVRMQVSPSIDFGSAYDSIQAYFWCAEIVL